jgi:hypothetical protein
MRCVDCLVAFGSDKIVTGDSGLLMDLACHGIVAPLGIWILMQGLQSKTIVRDQYIPAEEEESARIEGYEADLFFLVFEVDDPESCDDKTGTICHILSQTNRWRRQYQARRTG